MVYQGYSEGISEENPRTDLRSLSLILNLRVSEDKKLIIDSKLHPEYHSYVNGYFPSQAGLVTSLLIVVILFVLGIIGGGFYLFQKSRVTIPSEVGTQTERGTQRGDILKDTNLPIYPGSQQKYDVIDTGSIAGKVYTFAVATEPKEIAYFYVDELKKLGVSVTREWIDEQLSGYLKTSEIIFVNEKVVKGPPRKDVISVQIGTQKNNQGLVEYQIVVPVSY